MDWRTVRFDWNQARAFLVTAEEGSYSAAARALGLAQPTIGRQVQALEEELGVALFERVGRGVALTDAGAELVEHVRTMGQAATRVSLAAAGQSTALEGRVAVTASQALSAFLLPPVIAAIRAEHPGITIDLVAANDVRDLRRREADIALRNVQPTDPELVARRLPDLPGRLYASSAYLDRVGRPMVPEDLAPLDLIGFADPAAMAAALQGMGAPVTEDRFVICSEDHLVQWSLCRQGLGVCVMIEAVGDPDPDVERVLPDLPPLPVPVWLTAHRELRTSRRVRVVFDAIAEALSG